MCKVTKVLASIFTKPVRATLYVLGLAAVPSLIAAHDLPGWAAPLAAPFLLALLHLNPSDVETGDTDDVTHADLLLPYSDVLKGNGKP